MARYYRNIVGSLLWLTLASRPDAQFAVTRLTRCMKTPTAAALVAAKRLLRYFKGTAGLPLVYDGNVPFTLAGQCDASWGNDLATRRSYSGFFFSVCGGAISWTSKLQRAVSLSTVESEYLTYSEACKEALWLRKLCHFMKVPCTSPTTILNDNNGENPIERLL